MYNVNYTNWLKDSVKALEILEKEVDSIGIVGFSLGATYSILNTVREKPSQIKRLALWAPTFNPRDDMLQRYVRNGDYKKAKQNNLVKYGKKVSKNILDSLNFDVLEELSQVECPIFICHADRDPFIPIKATLSAKDKIKNLEDILIVKNAGHSFKTVLNKNDNPRYLVYEKTLSFLKKYL